MAQEEPEDAAAEAFEALRAEVIQLRAGVGELVCGLPRAGVCRLYADARRHRQEPCRG